MGGPGSSQSDASTAKAVVVKPPAFSKFDELKAAVAKILPEAQVDEFGGEIVIFTGLKQTTAGGDLAAIPDEDEGGCGNSCGCTH